MKISNGLQILAMLSVLWGAGAAYAHKDVPPPGGERPEPPKKKTILHALSDLMMDVSARLTKGETGQETQTEERKIVRVLDQLIEKARQQQQSSSDNQDQQQQEQREKEKEKPQPKPQPQNAEEQQKKKKQEQQKSSKPLSDSKAVKGRAGAGRLDDQNVPAGIEWGSLPPRLRDDVLNATGEEFPEKYRELLKLYYKNLSEK